MENKYQGGIWKKTVTTAKGKFEVLSITIGDQRYTAWPNSFKKPGEKSPDYRIQVDNWTPSGNGSKPVDNGTDDLPF